MPWNPDTYLRFKNIRFQPFYDLADLIVADHLKTAIDLGCGTGEQTAILAEKFPSTHFLGIDASSEMLEKSKTFASENLSFRQSSVADVLASGEKWDLVFSNAALQWSDNHTSLFPQLLERLQTNGQFAVQMPMQPTNSLNIMLLEVVKEAPFATYLHGFAKESPVLSMDEYAQILFDGGLENLNIFQKIYPIVADSADTLYDFIASSALIPYMERLDEEQKEKFVQRFKVKIAEKYRGFPVIYPFKRILMYGVKRR
ncbi:MULTISPECIES: methyltransferase domain-containing protein [Chitinophagaceae]